MLATATLGDAGKVGDPPVCSRRRTAAGERKRAAPGGGSSGHRLSPSAGIPGQGAVRRRPGAESADSSSGCCAATGPPWSSPSTPAGSTCTPTISPSADSPPTPSRRRPTPRWLPEAGEPHRVTRLLWTPPLRPEEIGAGLPLGNRPGVDFLVDVQAWSARKAEALRAHRTQHLSINRIWFDRPDPEWALSSEPFRQAWGPPLRSRPEADLFAGMEAGAGTTPPDSR